MLSWSTIPADSYKINPYRLPSLVYCTIIYNGSLFVSLHRGDTPSISEPYPPGTQIKGPSSSNDNITWSGTVMDISLDPTTSLHYLIQFDNSTTKLIPASKMPSLIPKSHNTTFHSSHLLPPFLHLNSKITFKHEGRFHKGYLTKSPEGTFCFSYKSHIIKKHPDWSVPLPNLPSTWHDLCTDIILLPAHSVTSFIWDKSANIVSAVRLLWECPRFLLMALTPRHPDRETWLLSFHEEKDGIESQNTYNVLNLAEYRALQEKGAP
jgi:hypothetical protein